MTAGNIASGFWTVHDVRGQQPGDQAKPTPPLVRDWQGAADFLERTHGLPISLPTEDVAPFLATWGFPAADSCTWRTDAFPQLRIRVPTHGELGGQRHYAVACELRDHLGGRTFSWVGLRTLVHLRSGLHDPVKQALGTVYHEYFGSTPFARHMGPPGTTARLEAWCGSLAAYVNARHSPPWLLAKVLQLLDIPTLTGLRDAAACAAPSPTDMPQPPMGLGDLPLPPLPLQGCEEVLFSAGQSSSAEVADAASEVCSEAFQSEATAATSASIAGETFNRFFEEWAAARKGVAPELMRP